MRKKILAANWKMNLLVEEARELLDNLNSVNVPEGRRSILALPYIYLSLGKERITNENISISAQNMHMEEKGAYTGEISGTQLISLGVNHVIIGHSERRTMFHEDNSILNQKLKKALELGITPIFCIGEPKEEREKKTYEAFLYKQLKEGLEGISKEEIKTMIFAYEPIWAIGSGKPMGASDIHSMCEFVRNTLEVMAPGVKEEVHILYGGSVNGSTIDDMMASPQVDGVLVGGASLKYEEFKRIIEFEV
ncbi:MAG: triose-phosphate isomerase [Tissierellia bacterium]|nr:triose-phosphate isomerase [Tissierellia bacterium]